MTSVFSLLSLSIFFLMHCVISPKHFSIFFRHSEMSSDTSNNKENYVSSAFACMLISCLCAMSQIGSEYMKSSFLKRVPMIGYLLEFSILATSKVISGWAPTCDSVQSGRLYSPWRNQDACTLTWYPTQSPYPDTERTSPCFILVMLSAWLRSDKYHFYKSLVWLDWQKKLPISNTRSLCSTDSATAPGEL